MRGLRTMAELVAGHAARRPDAIAISFLDRDTSFAALEAWSNRIAGALIADGACPGDRIAVLGKNSDDYLALTLGAAKARVCMVAINWRLAPAEIPYVLEHSQARHLFVEPEFAETNAKAIAAAPDLVRALVIDPPNSGSAAADWWDAASAEPPPMRAEPGDDFVQMYTSGTTGLPKGVVLSHANYLAAFAQSQQLPWSGYDETDVVFPPSPFFHVAGINIALRSLAGGCRLVLRPVFQPQDTPKLIEQERVTRTVMVPAVVAQLLKAPQTRELDLSSLKAITYGGSPMPPPVLEEAKAVFGCDFVQGYGLTECTGQATTLSPDAHDPARGKYGSCGCALPGTELRIVDPQDRDLPPRQVGEILVRSPTNMTGYWRNPEATAQTLRDGWLYTGDAGYLDEEGFLYIHDRVKDMIVSGGENIYPTEVETALVGHPAIAEVAVIGVPDDRWGEAVKALVVLRPGMEAQPGELIAYARERIAGYKLPKSVDFVGPLPRNATGKVMRRELRTPFWAGRDKQV